MYCWETPTRLSIGRDGRRLAQPDADAVDLWLPKGQRPEAAAGGHRIARAECKKGRPLILGRIEEDNDTSKVSKTFEVSGVLLSKRYKVVDGYDDNVLGNHVAGSQAGVHFVK